MPIACTFRADTSQIFLRKLGQRLKVLAVIDPAIDRATRAVQSKRCAPAVFGYQDTCIFASLDDLVKNMSSEARPHAVIVGSPPMLRGRTKSGKDIEMQILKVFPGIAIFIEKPITTGPAAEIQDAFKVARAINAAGGPCSVGLVIFVVFRSLFGLTYL
jgi:predicted dehydrogenase